MCSENILHRLERRIIQRATSRPAGSYTAELLNRGLPFLAGKLCEEMGELIQAASQAESAPKQVAAEAADTLYHLLVLLTACNVSFGNVEAELARRFARDQ